MIAGWSFNLAFFKSWVPGLATMKLGASLCFLLCGFGSFVASFRAWEKEALLQWMLGSCAFLTIGIMTGFLTEETRKLVPIDDPSPVQTIVAGEPSKATQVTFLAAAFGLLTFSFNGTGRFVWIRQALGPLISLVGVISLFGRVLGEPGLYFYWPGVSGAMALPTSVGYLALGYVLFHIQRFGQG